VLSNLVSLLGAVATNWVSSLFGWFKSHADNLFPTVAYTTEWGQVQHSPSRWCIQCRYICCEAKARALAVERNMVKTRPRKRAGYSAMIVA
jgi:hypothetical protein